MPVEDAQLRTSHTDNAAAWLTVYMFLRDYHKSNNEYWKTEFVFKFINQNCEILNFV